jgi:hypothetical protein
MSIFNQFTASLLLHPFCKEPAMELLNRLNNYPLNDNLKRSLFFLRGARAFDIAYALQLNRLDAVVAKGEVNFLKNNALILPKEKARAANYMFNLELVLWQSDPAISISQGNPTFQRRWKAYTGCLTMELFHIHIPKVNMP